MNMNKKYISFHHPRALAERVILEIERTEVRTVSFDVFDTLIHRRAHPDAVLLAVSKWLLNRLKILGCTVTSDPIDVRNRVYAQLISQKASLGLDLDVSLDELTLPWVIGCAGRDFDDAAFLAEQVAAIECEYEQATAFCNPDFLSLTRKLKNQGIRLIYTSDMYLGAKYIDRILDSCGYKGIFEASYASGDHSLLKRTGRLFDLVLEKEGLKSNLLLHVGDNRVSDGEKPSTRGIKALVHDYKKMVRRNYRMEYDYRRMQVDPSWMGVVAAQYAEAGLDEIATPEEAYGQRVLGPVFTSFVHRLAERCKEEGIQRVYFIAREGYLLKQLFENIAPVVFGENSSQPKAYYLSISRLTTFLASIKNFSLREITASFNNTPHYSIRTLLAPLKLDESFLSALGQRCGITDIDAALPPFFKEWPPFHRLLEDSLLKNKIEFLSSSTNKLLNQYLEEQEFFTDPKVALVDVGWSAQIQDNLYKAISERPNCPQIYGIYLGTTLAAHWRKTPNNWVEWTHGDYSHLGWFGRSAFEFVQGLEAVVRSPHGTTVGYIESEGIVKPVYKAETESSRITEAKDDPTIALFQNGIREFSAQYSQAAKMFGFTASDTLPYSRMMMNRMVRFPSSEEAAWLLKIKNVSDLGSTDIFTLGCQHKLSIFRPRAMLHELRRSFWKYGVLSINTRGASKMIYTALTSIHTTPKTTKNLCEGIVFTTPTKISCAHTNTAISPNSKNSEFTAIESLQANYIAQGRKAARILSIHTATSPLSLREIIPIHLVYRLVRIGCFFSDRQTPYSDGLSIKGFLMRSVNGHDLIAKPIRYLRRNR